MWAVYALCSAVFAALTSILAKIGIEGVNSNLATAIRTVVVVAMAWFVVFVTGVQGGIGEISRKSWLFLALSGIATGASWLFYFKALQMGTEYGAQAVGLKNVGKLETGCKADITLFDMNSAAWFPRHNLVSLLVYSANAGSVDTVLCDGKVIMEKKELKTLDAERILFEAERCAMRLTK